MEVIAKTQNGMLVSATTKEVEEILRAVTGKTPEKIEIGQKIPAIDYASTITKIKSLNSSNIYQYMLSRIEEFNGVIDQLKEAINSASRIDE